MYLILGIAMHLCGLWMAAAASYGGNIDRGVSAVFGIMALFFTALGIALII